jgi:hypothetical protein
MYGLDNAKSSQELFYAMRIHYNFINQVIAGQTPGEVAGKDSNLADNKVENLMIQTAINQTPRWSLSYLI